MLLYRDGSTVGLFACLGAVPGRWWRVAEAVLLPPGSPGLAASPVALNESCLWEWLAQWDLMMRMSDKLESLLSEGLDGADGDPAEGVYRNLALRYAAQLEDCCQLLYGDDVAAELGIQRDGLSVERWSCGGQFLVDVIGRWVFGPSFGSRSTVAPPRRYALGGVPRLPHAARGTGLLLPRIWCGPGLLRLRRSAAVSARRR